MTEKKLVVKVHAIDRFNERIFKNEDTLKILSKEEMNHISKLIIDSLLEECPEIMELGEGEYIVNSYNMRVKVANYQIVTVMELGTESLSSLRGGIMRSGKKMKKYTMSAAKIRKQKRQEEIDAERGAFD